MSTAAPTHVPESLGSMDFSEAKVEFAQAYQADVLGAFERAIRPDLVGRQAITDALQSFFEDEKKLARSHQSTLAGLVGNITTNEKAVGVLTRKMQKNHDIVMNYLENFVTKILEACNDDVTVPEFSEALRHEIERIRPLQDSEDKIEEGKILEMYLARMGKNHEALVSQTRETGSPTIARAPRNITKKPSAVMKILYAIPVTALAAEVFLSTQGVGQRLLTSSESLVHGDGPEGTIHSLLVALNDHQMLAPTSYGTAFACSILINSLLRGSLNLWSTSRKGAQIRAAVKEKDGTDKTLTEEVVKRLKKQKLSKKK